MDLGVAVEAIPDRVASDFVDFAANCAVQDVVPSIFIHDDPILRIFWILKMTKLLMIKFLTLNLLSYTESVEVHDFVGTEVDSSMDNMVGGTANNIKWVSHDCLWDHESPVDHHFTDP